MIRICYAIGVRPTRRFAARCAIRVCAWLLTVSLKGALPGRGRNFALYPRVRIWALMTREEHRVCQPQRAVLRRLRLDRIPAQAVNGNYAAARVSSARNVRSWETYSTSGPVFGGLYSSWIPSMAADYPRSLRCGPGILPFFYPPRATKSFRVLLSPCRPAILSSKRGGVEQQALSRRPGVQAAT